MTGPRKFRFVGVERELRDPLDWNRADWPRLWLYNAHYFDDLVADYAAKRRAWQRELIAHWIQENPPGIGVGWEPYPLSLRIVNWSKWSLIWKDLEASAWHSLAVQARWLMRRLEWHLLGNHLWANAKALIFAGTVFSGTEADRWRRRGLAILKFQLKEQILSDGGHFELSPMYHAILLEDVLDLVQLDQRFPGVLPDALINACKATAVKMLAWLEIMTHPDGQIALFNDAAFGIAPKYSDLVRYAHSLGFSPPAGGSSLPLRRLAASGYAHLALGPANLIVDIGAVGPDYLPGHAHADTLSFELSLHGKRLMVNGGTSTYEASAERVRQRGTAAHNALMIDGHDSSEVWSSFRVARRARIVDVRVIEEIRGKTIGIAAAHDGYRRLSAGLIHERCWQLAPTHLKIYDIVKRYLGHEAVIHYHLAPQWQVRPVTDGSWEVVERESYRTVCTITFGGEAVTKLVPFRWTPAFGHEEIGQSLIVRCPTGAELHHVTEIRWGIT